MRLRATYVEHVVTKKREQESQGVIAVAGSIRSGEQSTSKSSSLRSLTCSFSYEEEADSTTFGAKHIAGIDECARGNLFGPTVAAAVILPRGEIRDSKLITPKKRERLAEEIKLCAVAWCRFAERLSKPRGKDIQLALIANHL
jgi:hypothetical protein